MSDGRRWLALDADLFGKRFTDELYRQFGWAGVVTWVAFLCACKRSRVPGQISVSNDTQTAHLLGIADWELVDNDGKPWTLSDFWTFTGRKKQTKRTSRGRHFDVVSTHWGRWQDAAGRAREAERMRTSRAEKRAERAARTANTSRTNVRLDSDLDLDLPPTPPRGTGRRFAPNGNGNPQPPTGRPIADWHPEPQPATTIDPAAALNALRAERGWTEPEADQ